MRKEMMDKRDRKAFYEGFVDGLFIAGFRSTSRSLADSKKYDVSVSQAWSEVGRAFSKVIAKENVDRGKKIGHLKERTRAKSAA